MIAPALAVAGAQAAMAAGPQIAAESARRPWNADISVEARYVVPELDSAWMNKFDDGQNGPSLPISVSPDRRHFFFVTFRGDLARDCVRSDLVVFSVSSIREALTSRTIPSGSAAPRATASLCSPAMGATYPAIGNPRWVDNERIQFLGVDGGGHRNAEIVRRGYEVDVANNRVRAVTDPAHDVDGIFAAEGGSALYLRFEQERIEQATTYPVTRFSNAFGYTLPYLYPWTFRRTLYATREGAAPRRIDNFDEYVSSSTLGGSPSGASISPGGRWAILAYRPSRTSPPATWAGYLRGAASDGLGAAQFMLIDIGSGTSRPLVDAPWGYAASHKDFWGPIADGEYMLEPTAYWSFDGRSAVVVNTALPLSEGDAARRSTTYAIGIDPQTGAYEVLTSLEVAAQGSVAGYRVRQIGWVRPGRELLVIRETLTGRRLPGLAIVYASGRWQVDQRPAAQDQAHQVRNPLTGQLRPPSLGDGIEILLEQGSNQPQMMIARRGRRSVALLPPDPALAGVVRLPFRPVTWRGRGGEAHHGLLLSPSNSRAGAPPLVVQVQNADARVFLPDGASTGGVSAQALAARGIAVLYMTPPPIEAHLREVARGNFHSRIPATEAGELIPFREALDDAVAGLSAQGLANPNRVGLAGFSRNGFMTYYTITHPGRTRIRASSIIDSLQYGWYEYTRYARDTQIDRMYGGGRSLWQDKAAFMAGMPIFNVDRVQGATLFQYLNDQQLFTAQENLAAFQRNRRPMEWLHYGPDGTHIFHAPAQRRASIEATVAWMAFWLLDQVPPPLPHDPDRPQRWQRLRAEWQRQQAWEAAGHPVGSAAPAGSRPPQLSNRQRASRISKTPTSAPIPPEGQATSRPIRLRSGL